MVEMEFRGIQDYPMSETQVQIVTHLEKTLLDVLRPHHHVVHAPDMVGEPLGDGVVLSLPLTKVIYCAWSWWRGV